MKKEVKKAVVLLIPLGILAGVTILSLMPPRYFPHAAGWFVDIPYGDRIVHFLFYFLLITALRFARTYTSGYTRKCPWVLLVFAAVYGGAIELLQGAYFGRGCELGDEAANVLGAIVAIWGVPRRWHERLADKLGSA